MQLVPLKCYPAFFQRIVLLAALALGLAALPPAALGQSLNEPCLVVALDKLDGTIYERKVMVATPVGDGSHVGFILNHPTRATMAQEYPDHAPSRAVSDPIYYGGPLQRNALFALTRVDTMGRGVVYLAPGVQALVDQPAIDAFMERSPNEARYYVGHVGWRAGVLENEVKTGQVMLREFNADMLFRPDTSTLYDELVTKNRKPPLST